MNYSSSKDNTIKSITVLVMFVFMLLSNISVFGQSIAKGQSIDNSTETVSAASEVSASNSNMNFVLWFMGSKQDPNSTISVDATNKKKQIMMSGMAPNRLLIKAFLKKAVDYESSLS